MKAIFAPGYWERATKSVRALPDNSPLSIIPIWADRTKIVYQCTDENQVRPFTDVMIHMGFAAHLWWEDNGTAIIELHY